MSLLDLVRKPNLLATVKVRDSEGAGTTTLTSADERTQIFNLSAARTCQLPSANIKKGDKWIVKKSDSVAKLTIQCGSAASATSKYIPSSQVICYLDSTFASAEFIAKQDTPTTPDHWEMDFRFIEKLYHVGGTYNSITITLTGTGDTGRDGNFTPYQTYDGNWGLKLNVQVKNSTTTNAATVTIPGIEFCDLDFTTSGEAGWALAGSKWSDGALERSIALKNTDDIYMEVETASYYFYWSGDVCIKSKPTWAY